METFEEDPKGMPTSVILGRRARWSLSDVARRRFGGGNSKTFRAGLEALALLYREGEASTMDEQSGMRAVVRYCAAQLERYSGPEARARYESDAGAVIAGLMDRISQGSEAKG